MHNFNIFLSFKIFFLFFFYIPAFLFIFIRITIALSIKYIDEHYNNIFLFSKLIY